jgi:hypothetical protein
VVDVGSVEALELVVDGSVDGATDVEPVVVEPLLVALVVIEPVAVELDASAEDVLSGDELVPEPQLVISPIPKLTDQGARRISSRNEPANAPTIVMVRCSIAVTSGCRSACSRTFALIPIRKENGAAP